MVVPGRLSHPGAPRGALQPGQVACGRPGLLGVEVMPVVLRTPVLPAGLLVGRVGCPAVALRPPVVLGGPGGAGLVGGTPPGWVWAAHGRSIAWWSG